MLLVHLVLVSESKHIEAVIVERVLLHRSVVVNPHLVCVHSTPRRRQRPAFDTAVQFVWGRRSSHGKHGIIRRIGYCTDCITESHTTTFV